jgi:hypothetical protein
VGAGEAPSRQTLGSLLRANEAIWKNESTKLIFENLQTNISQEWIWLKLLHLFHSGQIHEFSHLGVWPPTDFCGYWNVIS